LILLNSIKLRFLAEWHLIKFLKDKSLRLLQLYFIKTVRTIVFMETSKQYVKSSDGVIIFDVSIQELYGRKWTNMLALWRP